MMTPEQRELSEKLYGSQHQSVGAAVNGAFQEVRSALFPGLTLDKITSDIGQELKHQVAAGAHELAAALFASHSFVMYQRSADAKDDHGIHGPEQTHDNTLRHESPSQDLDRGRRM